MKIFVTGVKGQLGFDVVNELEKRGHDAVGVDIQDMDITDKAAVKKKITEQRSVSYGYKDRQFIYKQREYFSRDQKVALF